MAEMGILSILRLMKEVVLLLMRIACFLMAFKFVLRIHIVLLI